MDEIIKLISEVGFPIAATLVSGYFIYLTIKFILAGVLSSINDIATKIAALDIRVKNIDNDVVRVDLLVSTALGLRPDTNRVSRNKGVDDARKD